MRRLIALTLLGVVLCATAMEIAVHIYRAPGPLGRNTALVIPRGGIDEVGATLAAAGAIGSPLFFKIATIATFADGGLHAAELEFPAHASLAGILHVLRAGRPVQHHLTLAEGLTAAQISALLARAEGLSGDIAVPDEGSVLPETYDYTRGTKRGAIMTRAQQAMRQFLAAAWPGRAPGLPLASPGQAVILASIVEREARLPAERKMIARVFLNRLASQMRLQADPTSIYGASGGLGSLNRALTHDDLARNDPYNTYVIAGLPAGPICSPGTAAITAVLHPADGPALYFVSDGTGGHVFATTLATHNENVTRLRGSRR